MRIALASVVAAAAGLGPWLPPSPSTWPAYPDFQARASCWARPTPGGGRSGTLQAAPSYLAKPTGESPKEIVARLLARFGDDRYVHSIQIGPVPPIARMHLQGWFAGARPPKNAAWAYIAAPSPDPKADPIAYSVAGWEADLLRGALRDDMCDAGGRPLVGWSVSGQPGGVFDRAQAMGQRFPSPGAEAFRARLASVGARYGFTVASLQMLRARQYAPLLVLQTSRPRKEFVHDVPAIFRLLDPVSYGHGRTAITFEGFFLAARDGAGPFVSVEDVYRGETMGGEWSWDPCVYPFPHSEPAGQHC